MYFVPKRRLLEGIGVTGRVHFVAGTPAVEGGVAEKSEATFENIAQHAIDVSNCVLQRINPFDH